MTEALKQAKASGKDPEIVIHEQLNVLSEMAGGYDFALVIAVYWKGHDSGNEQPGQAAHWQGKRQETRPGAALRLPAFFVTKNGQDWASLIPSTVTSSFGIDAWPAKDMKRSGLANFKL